MVSVTEKEIRTIKKYYRWPATAVAFLGSGVLELLYWVFLQMIGSIVFHQRGGDDLTFYAGLAVSLLCLFLFLFQMISMIWGVKGKKWRAIVEKAQAQVSQSDYTSTLLAANGAIAAGRLMSHSKEKKVQTAGQVASTIGGVVSLFVIAAMLLEIRKNAKTVAQLVGVKLPGAVVQVLLIVFVPFLLLSALAVPGYLQSTRQIRSAMDAACVTVQELETTFDMACDSTYANDPHEQYWEYGYDVSGSFYHKEGDLESYIRVTVNNEGVVDEVAYCMDIDVSLSKQENLERCEADMARLNQMLLSADVVFASKNLNDVHTLNTDFVEQFQSASYYKEFRIRDDDAGMYFSYSTDSEEDYNRYSSSYIYVTVEPVEAEAD